MTQLPQKYPFYPPADADLNIYQRSSLRINPTSAQKQAKTCPKCLYPIHCRIFVKPCNHYLCYECYSNNTKQCQYCNMPIYQFVKLQDREIVYSCDTQCSKVFMSQQQLEQHKSQHQLLKENDKKL